VARRQVEVRELEVDWYINNYTAIQIQAATLAGFAFEQLKTPIPQGELAAPFVVEFFYMVFTCMAMGLQLCAIVTSAYFCVWGPSLALRGARGSKDMSKAVDCLRDYQTTVFLFFLVGVVIFFMSSILGVWVYFPPGLAVVVTFPLSFFIVAFVWFTVTLSNQLRVADEDIVGCDIHALQPYETVADLDDGLHRERFSDRRPGGYCPLHPQDVSGIE